MKGRPPAPPRVPEWILRRVLPTGTVGDTILGDAREEFARDLTRGGIRHARGR